MMESHVLYYCMRISELKMQTQIRVTQITPKKLQIAGEVNGKCGMMWLRTMENWGIWEIPG